MKTHELRESSTFSKSKVDWEKGIIYGVKVLSESSRNGFVYPLATRQKAHRLLENLRVNIDHLAKKNAKEDVPLAARFGKLVNIREGKGGTYADLKFNVKHKLAESIAYAAQELPDTLGMSINGGGRGGKRTADGKIIVEEITRLRSCDVVADPGSTHTLFESAMEPETPSGPTPSMQGIMAEINAMLSSASDEEAMLTALEEFIAKKRGGDEEEEEEGKEKKVEESLSEEEQLARLKAEKACLVLCESLKVEPTSDLIELLADLPTEAKRKALIAKVGKKVGVKAPKSAPVTLRESAPTPTPAADPAAERARLVGILRGRN